MIFWHNFEWRTEQQSAKLQGSENVREINVHPATIASGARKSVCEPRRRPAAKKETKEAQIENKQKEIA